MSKFNTSNAANSIVNIIQTSIGNAAFDTTIRAIVQEKVDEATGKFKLQYQDGLFYAFADDVKVNYSKGTEVFVLVPKNDFTQDKRIIGSVKTLGEDYAKVYSYDERYKKIGSSAFGEAVNNNSWTFPKDAGQRLQIWPADISNPKITFDDTFLNYLKNDAVTGLWLEAEFTTDIDLQYKKDASYGLLLTAEMEGSESQIGFQFDINDFTGNPFSQVNSRQIVVWEDMEWKKISQITGLYAFCNGLEGNLISVKNIKMYAVSAFTEEQLNMPYVDFYTPEGLYIKSESSITLKAQLHIDQKIVTNEVKYYWFRETPSVFKDSQVFHPYAGNGWELLNGYEITTDAETEKKISVVKDTDKQILRLGDASSNSNELLLSPDFSVEKIMCVVAKSDSERYSSIVEVHNNQWESPYYIYYGGAVPTSPIELFDTSVILKCKKKNSNTTEDQPNAENADAVLFVAEEMPEVPNPEGPESMDGEILTNADWYKKDISSQEYVKINSSAGSLTIKPADVDNQATYCAMVGDIQTNEVIIIKKQQLPDYEQKQYQLFIYGGDQKFLYDENGRSPTHPAREFPEFPSELSFKLYDNVNGSEVEISDLDSIVWEKGNSESLIKDVEPYSTNIENAKCRFTIQDNWKYNTTDNQITLTVKYNGIELTTTTNFVFVKQGDPGTNGTEDVYWIENEPDQKGDYYLKLYKNGDQVDAIWKLLTNKAEQQWDSKASDKVTSSVSILSSSSEIKWSSYKILYSGVPYCYIAAYSDNIMRAVYCINWKKIGDTYTRVPTPLSQGQYIVYDADGQNPKYANSKIIDGIEIPIADKVKNLPDIKTYTAALAKNNGLTGITYELKDDKGNITATYYITLYASLSRHAFSMVNGWDGNLKIDEGGNAVLAQSLIAGTKDTNNTFTGIMAGTIGKQDENSSSKMTTKTGFFAFAQGKQTVFINAEDGSTILGPSDKPLLSIGNAKEEFIQSSNYGTDDSLKSYKATDSKGATLIIPKDEATATPQGDGRYEVTYNGTTYEDCIPIYRQGMKIDLKKGDIYAPGYSIVSGNATFEGTVKANSGEFNQVTIASNCYLKYSGDKGQINVGQMLNSLNSKIEDLQIKYDYDNTKVLGLTWTDPSKDGDNKYQDVDFPEGGTMSDSELMDKLAALPGDGFYTGYTTVQGKPQKNLYVSAAAIKTGLIGVYQTGYTYPNGYLGTGTGDAGGAEGTPGIILKAGIATNDPDNVDNFKGGYVIVTTEGARLSAGQTIDGQSMTSFWVTSNQACIDIGRGGQLKLKMYQGDTQREFTVTIGG